jgi:hypothetical protein
MKISGFTIVKNAVHLKYPVLESIRSILPICDEFIVNVGKSDDGTLDLIKSINSPKIKIVETVWDMTQGPLVLSVQTNIALEACTGDWAFYLQTDEVVHEADLPKLKRIMEDQLHNKEIDVLRFKWFHFFGSHFRYRIDLGWYQKQDRIIRNNKEIRSCGDAFAFEHKDGRPLKSFNTGCFIYHYGWVFSEEDMAKRRINQGEIWSQDRSKEKTSQRYEFGDLNRFPVYFGSHPSTMQKLIQNHQLSQQDWTQISRSFWWNPLKIFRIRYKTGKRIKYSLDKAANQGS